MPRPSLSAALKDYLRVAARNNHQIFFANPFFAEIASCALYAIHSQERQNKTRLCFLPLRGETSAPVYPGYEYFAKNTPRGTSVDLPRGASTDSVKKTCRWHVFRRQRRAASQPFRGQIYLPASIRCNDGGAGWPRGIFPKCESRTCPKSGAIAV